MFILCLHQLRLRDYFFDNQNKAPIGPDDILNIFPVVKHIHLPTVDASTAHRAAQTFLQKGGSGKLATLQKCRRFMHLESLCSLCVFEQNLNDKSKLCANLLCVSQLQVCWIRPMSI